MVSFAVLKVSCLALLILVSAVHFGKGLAADHNHKSSVDEPAATDVGNADKEDVALQYANHSLGSTAVRGSRNHSVTGEPEREASVKLAELTVANRSLSSLHSNDSTNVSVVKSSANRTAANFNVSSTEHALNDSARSSASNFTDASNYSQAENTVHATLCANDSVDKGTMRVEVEFASTLLENGLY